MAPPRPVRNRPNGVALGVLGMMLLVFFSMVFMLGRHHYSISETYEAVVHDPRYQHVVQSIEGRSTGKNRSLHDLRWRPTQILRTGSKLSPDIVRESSPSNPSPRLSPLPSPKPSPLPSPKPSPSIMKTSPKMKAAKTEGLSDLDNKYKPTK